MEATGDLPIVTGGCCEPSSAAARDPGLHSRLAELLKR
jgi:hypothetical protein